MTKRLIVLMVGLVFIAALILVSVFVFRVDNIEVDFEAETSVGVSSDDVAKIIEASGIQKGKSIFSMSESGIVKNIENALPDVNVINIERRFPNKVTIHVSKRVQTYVISYRLTQSGKESYVLVDGDMVVLEFVDTLPSGDYIMIEGFDLIGGYTIETGKTLPVEFGNEIYYLQNISASFYNAGMTPVEFRAFVVKISFDNDMIELTTNSGVVLVLGGKLTTQEVSERVPKAYEWYCSQEEGSPSLTKGIASYDSDTGKFIWNNI